MPVTRRSLLGIGLATAAGSLTGCGGASSGTSWVEPGSGPDGSAPSARSTSTPAAPSAPAGSPTATPATTGPDTVTARSTGTAPYAATLTENLRRMLRPSTENPKRASYAGAVALVLVDGKVTAHTAVGDAVRFRAGPVELPPSARVPMRPDSIFDLASVTKVYTAILALQQVDRGRLELAAPVVEYLPGFTGAGKAAVTVSMLLAHTSGLPVGATVGGLSNAAARRAAVLATPLVKGARPGRTFRYSSVGLMVLAQLVEKVAGAPLDLVLRTGLTGPLGLRDTGFNPRRWADPDRLVATDARTSRGLLRGTVHDDVTAIMGGVGGSAGIFSTARDLAVVGQLLADGGQYAGKRVLAPGTVQRMLRNANPGLPAIDPERPRRTSAHGLGVVLDQPWFMGRLATPATFGHTGFTGTSLLVHPGRRMVLVLLTNRAHPNWSWADPDPVRVTVANVVA